MAEEHPRTDFNALVSTIRQVHKHLAARASRAVNISLTLRNWLIGAYIAEFELNGEDRAAYGEGLLVKLAATLKEKKVSSCGKRQLYNYLHFYQTYPEIVRLLPAQLGEVPTSGMILPVRKCGHCPHFLKSILIHCLTACLILILSSCLQLRMPSNVLSTRLSVCVATGQSES